MSNAEEKLRFLENVFDDESPKEKQQNSQSSPTLPVLNPLDPRPDITDDHHLWKLILHNAKELYDIAKPINDAGSTSVYKLLYGIRVEGAKLMETKQAFKLLPGDEELSDPDEWEWVKRRWLDPIKDDLVSLFKLSKIGRVVDEELPEEVAKTFARGEAGPGGYVEKLGENQGENEAHKQQNLDWRQTRNV